MEIFSTNGGGMVIHKLKNEITQRPHLHPSEKLTHNGSQT